MPAPARPAGRVNLGQLIAGSAAALLGGLGIATFGPVVGLTLIVVVGAGVAVASHVVLALAVPFVVAPVGLVNVPGLGGIQVIHLATIAAIAGVGFSVLTARVRYAPPAAMGWGALFVAAMLIATMTSADPLSSLRVSTNHLLSFGFAVSAAVVVRSSRQGLAWLLRLWAAAGMALIVPALPSALLAGDRFGGTLVEGRVQGAFAQPNDFGEFALLCLVASAALYAGGVMRADRWLGGAGMLVGLAGVAVSFSRGTWTGLAAGVVVVGLLSAQLRRPLVVAASLAILATAAGAAMGVRPFPTLAQRFFGLFAGSANPEDDRAVIFNQAWEVFLDNPITGLGPGTFLLSNQFAGSELILRTYIHGHSILLTAAAEMGLIGLLALLAFAGSLAVSALHARQRLLAANNYAENARLAVLCGGLVAVAVHGLTDVVYTNPLLIPLAWFLAGATAGECAAAIDQARPPDRATAEAPA